MILDAQAAFLEGQKRDVTSQFGEDGYVRALFDRIGTVNRWCFEVGAVDGLVYSNSKQWVDEGWNAVLIESDAEQFKKLEERSTERVHVVHEHVNADSMDTILADAGAPVDMDLGVIDIDGQDYHVWEGMQTHRPRVMLVEYAYNTHREPDAFVPPLAGPQTNGTRGSYARISIALGQANFRAIMELGKAKGYTPLVATYCNILFCREELLT